MAELQSVASLAGAAARAVAAMLGGRGHSRSRARSHGLPVAARRCGSAFTLLRRQQLPRWGVGGWGSKGDAMRRRALDTLLPAQQQLVGCRLHRPSARAAAVRVQRSQRDVALRRMYGALCGCQAGWLVSIGNSLRGPSGGLSLQGAHTSHSLPPRRAV